METIFRSSGTTGMQKSEHHLLDCRLYEYSFSRTLSRYFPGWKDSVILGLLPGYLERNDSSLVYMVESMIKHSKHPKSGFYLNDFNTLEKTLIELETKQTPTILIGVSFALLDFTKTRKFQLKHTKIVETGGMKGRKKEITRAELHQIIGNNYGVKQVYSEYGMTELLSQAYSIEKERFFSPAWMKILIRETTDPFSYCNNGKNGAINIIDLANIHSCAFIATDDIGKTYDDGSFEVLGRLDKSAIRGCSLLA